jgi:HK97 family phage major capsid protein
MKKSVEMKKIFDAMKKSIEGLQAEGKIADAKAKLPELKDLQDKLEVQIGVERAEQAQFFNGGAAPLKNQIDALDKAERQHMRNRIFNKLVFGAVSGAKLDDEEKAYLDRTKFTRMDARMYDASGTPGQVGATPEKGGYLIPAEQFAQVLEFRRDYTALKDLCTVRPAGSRSGTQPTIGEEDGQLANFEELNEITKSDIDFGQLKYEIKDYGDIIPVARQLLQDIDVDLIGLIGTRFARKAINTENAQILAKMSALTAAAATSYKDISRTLNLTLDPAISDGAQIITNQSGFQYLDDLTDNEGRPMLTTSIADPTQKMFKGRKIVVLKNSLLVNDTATSGKVGIPFYIGSLADYCHFFDRVGVEIATSDQAGFTVNAIYIRAIERFDTVVADSAALASLKLTVDAANVPAGK